MGLKSSTLCRQTAALASVIPKIGGLPLTKHPHILQFLKGVSLKNPQQVHRFPTWRLNTVLNALTKAPFELAQTFQLKFLRMKAIFLVAITSARRVWNWELCRLDKMCAFSIKTRWSYEQNRPSFQR